MLERLKHSLQLLAAPVEQQLLLLPSYICRADELALEFSHWYEVVLDNYRVEMTGEQLSSLAAIDQEFELLTRAGKENWTEASLRSSTEWQNLRILAARALQMFGWKIETPPSYALEYVSALQPKEHKQN